MKDQDPLRDLESLPVEPAADIVPMRGHEAFLKGYAAEDEGLYDTRYGAPHA